MENYNQSQDKSKNSNKKISLIVGVVFVLIIVVVGILIFTSREKTEEPSTLSSQCAFACETSQKTAFCDVERKVTGEISETCIELSTNPDYSQYNVQSCPEISCSSFLEENSELASDQTCSGLEGTWETPGSDGKCPTKEGFFSRKRTAEDSPPTEGQICCYYYQ